MSDEVLFQIRNNPMLYRFLRDFSFHYQNLYRDDSYIKVIHRLAKEVYHMRLTDRLDALKNHMDLIQTFLSVME